MGIVSNTDLGSVRRVGLTAIATYACTTVFAVSLGTLLAKGLMQLAASLIDPRLIEVLPYLREGVPDGVLAKLL